MTDDAPQPSPDSTENTGGSTNINNTAEGGIGIGEGSQITVGQGDITGRDKKTAGGHIIEAAAGATVIIGAAPVAEEEEPAPGEPPFKGLQYFDEKDAEWFFGRELLVAKLVGKLRDNRFLAIVIGASGSGKSSIVRAGVIPALKRGDALADGSLPPQGSARWPFHIITPTIHPLESLAASLTRDSESVTATTTLMDDLARDSRSLHLAARKALSRNPASHLLVVVDQFEELFTLCKDEAERKAFIDNLITATDPKTDGPTIVIITMRADFYANCAAYASLREVLSSQQEYIGPMSPAELRRAMEEPAKHGGWEFEEGLVDHLLREVGVSDLDEEPEPGALPLLSHALLETWKRRRGRKMTFRGYEESGGVRGAIAKTADAVYQQFDERQQAIAKRIFLRLTELGEGQQDTRRRAELSELVPRPEEAATVQLVLKKLVDSRLVTTTESTAEVAHEALIREWPTLREWLAEGREALRVQRQITKEARDWDQQGRDNVDLLQGLRLIQAIEFTDEHPDELSLLEREFVAASRDEAQRKQAEREATRQRELEQAKELAETRKHQLETAEKLAATEKQRAEEQTRSAARLRRFALYLAGAFAVALVAAIVAVVAFSQAEENRKRADQQAQIALLRQLAGEGIGLLESQYDLALLLSAEGGDIAETVELKGSLLDGLQHSAAIVKYLRGHTAPVSNVAFSPDGKVLATGGDENDIYLWDVEKRELLTRLSGHQAFIYSLDFSAGGAQGVLASGDKNGNIILWDVSNKTQLASFAASADPAWAVDFSPDGKTLAVSSKNTILLWDVSDSRNPNSIGQLAGGHQDNADIYAVAFAPPDGKTLASAGTDTTITLWDVAAQKPLGPFTAPDDRRPRFGIRTLAFSPDGSLLASGGDDANIYLWDVEKRELRLDLLFHRATVYEVAFNLEGDILATGSADGDIVLWDVSEHFGTPFQILTGHSNAVYDLAFSPLSPGSLLASVSADTAVILWDTGISQPLGQTLTGHAENQIVRNAAYSPDGKYFASAGNDPVVILWDAATRTELARLVAHSAENSIGQVNTVAFSFDSKMLAEGSRDQSFVLWDIADPKNPRQLSQKLTAHDNRVWGVAFSPVAPVLATGGEDFKVKLWDISSPATVGEPLAVLSDHTNTVRWVGFNPKGDVLASSSRDATVILWGVSDPRNVEKLATLTGHTAEVVSAAFNPDGTLLATASEDFTVRLWDVSDPRNPKQIGQPLAGHTYFVRTVSFSADGNTLASGGSDNAIILWDVSDPLDPKRIGSPLFGHTDWVRGIAFSPDGKTLVSGSSDSLVVVWDMDHESWQSRACNIVARNFTQAEWQYYFGDKPYRKTCEAYPPGE
jgi:WD40 repeat protein